jgi:cytidylate kinase
MSSDLSLGISAGRTPLDRCLTYISTQLDPRKHQGEAQVSSPSGPAVTISHQAGSGAHEIAIRLADLLQGRAPSKAEPWTVFDRQLVEKVLEEHHMSQALAKYIPEDRQSALRQVMDTMFGVIPSAWDMVPKIAETVLNLADAGHVVLVGRGANFITASRPNVFHVRLMGSLPRRIQRVQEREHLSLEMATKAVTEEDRARGRYVKAHFGEGIEDDLLYHLVLNTDRVPPEAAAGLIADAARRCFPAVFP